ncbi:Alpha/Beta hydrolase protein, partial [Trichophaea hybrida]
GTTVTCSQSYCPSVSSAATVMLGEFESPGMTDIAGYIAADTTNKLIVVSFRGSSSFLNWITDLQVNLIDTDICSGCQAHLGFWGSWIEAQSEVLRAVTNGFGVYPNYQLVVTGHSLGGAVATIAVDILRTVCSTGVLLEHVEARKIGGRYS